MADGKMETTLGLGERLRSARKARALTIEQAAYTLKLDISILRALEDERYAVLGAPVFVRGHLKAYARLLDLSEEAVLQAYRAADPAADALPKVAREIEKPLTTSPGPLAILAAVLLALIAMGVIYALGSGAGPVVAPAGDSAPGQPAISNPEYSGAAIAEPTIVEPAVIESTVSGPAIGQQPPPDIAPAGNPPAAGMVEGPVALPPGAVE